MWSHASRPAQEIAADNDLAVKRQALRSLIGKEPEGLKNLRNGVQLAGPQPADIGKWVELAESGTATSWYVSPGANVTVPVAATKSSSVANSGFPAPGDAALHVTVTGTGDGADNVTGTIANVVPP